MATGYRFYPTEEELLGFYLHNKLQNSREDMEQVIPVADVYCFDPWELPPMSGVACREDGEQWFFFCPRQDRETQGGRPTRTTPSGYWKATGSPSLVFSSMNRAMGVKKTMVFYRGRAPTGTKTKWKMNEYRIFEGDVAAGAGAAAITFSVASKTRREFSLCRMYTRSGCIRSFDRRPLDATAASDDAACPFATRPPAAGSIKRSRTEDESTSSAGSGGDAASWRCVRRREDNKNNGNNDNFQLTLPEEDDYLELLDNWL